jgi:hypothetical protein
MDRTGTTSVQNMNATLTHKDETCQYSFDIEHEGETYSVVVNTNRKGEFLDEYIHHNNEELEHEGTEGQIREDIMTYLDENWDKIC